MRIDQKKRLSALVFLLGAATGGIAISGGGMPDDSCRADRMTCGGSPRAQVPVGNAAAGDRVAHTEAAWFLVGPASYLLADAGCLFLR